MAAEFRSFSNIKSKVAALGILAVLVSVGATTGTVVYLTRNDLVRQANESQDGKLKVLRTLLEAKGQPIKLVDGKLMAGSYVVNRNFEVVDQLTTMMGGTATIFMGEERVSTNVLKADGTRALGTKLVGVARDEVIGRGASYRGEANILDVPYFTAYDPLHDQNGAQVGVLYVGVRQDVFFRSFRSSMAIAGLIGLFLAALLGAGLIYAVGVYDRTMKEVVRLSKAADVISVGTNLEEELRTSRADEIGDLTRSLERLRQSMKTALARLDG